MSTKADRQSYINTITDAIINYRMTHESRNPECVVMSSALFRAIAGNKADPDKSKFGVVKIKVYESYEMNFCLTGKIHAITEKKKEGTDNVDM